MPVTKISANGTTQLKGPAQAGTLLGIYVTAPGTTWTIQVNDGPNQAGAVQPLLGATPQPVPAAGTTFPLTPLNFSNGLQIVMAGGAPAGEIEVSWG